MLLLGKNDMRKLFTMKDAIEAAKQALRIFSEGGCTVPLRVNIDTQKNQGQTLFMPGYIREFNSMGLKIVSIFPGNKNKGIPTVPATMTLIDGTNGQVCCIMDGTFLTQLRTGAAAGAATDVLARKDAKIGALIGTGGQAASQLEAMLTIRSLSEVRICGLNFDHTKAFTDRLQKELAHYGATLRSAHTSDDAIIDADIITTVTTSKQPVFNGRLVKKGAHINGIGSFTPDMQELDEYVLQRAEKIFCDSQEAVLAEAGDFIIPLQRGTFIEDTFTGEIGKVIAGSLRGRESTDEITLFKSVGMAALDVVTAFHIYQKALKQGIGQEFFFEGK